MARAAPPSPEGAVGADATVRYLQSLQNEDGGFRPSAAAGPSQLGSVTSSLRALKYQGGDLKHKSATLKFVRDCFDAASGGYADTPGGEVKPRFTAMGLMALAELKAVQKKQAEAARDYLNAKASDEDEIYLAAAAMEATKMRIPRAAMWIANLNAERRPDGAYGSPYRTATAVITIIRLGGAVTDRGAVLASLKSAQRPDGGFSAMGDASDLPTTYRMVRAFYMLRERPDLPRLREFVAQCRNADGGYGPSPGQPSTGAATYNASIVLHWAEELAE
jgi:hypothetical protein